MTTLSLLKNIDEVLSLKLKKLPIPDSGCVHPDFEWIRSEVQNWSKQYSIANSNIDNAYALFVSHLPFWTSNSVIIPSKERLLNYQKAIEITFYIDIYLKPFREERSEEKARDLIENLIKALKTGQCDQEYGKRLIDAISGMKNEMKSDHWISYETQLEKCLRVHLDTHSNYWLKNRFIEYESYVEKRFFESFWIILFMGFEYVYEYPIPDSLKLDPIWKKFEEKCIELFLAFDDHHMVINKILSNDITARQISYANDKKCSVQEAIDNHFEYTIGVYNECKELMSELSARREGTDRFRQYMEAILKYIGNLQNVVQKFEGFKVNSDQTLHTEKWKQMYDKIKSNQAEVIPFSMLQ